MYHTAQSNPLIPSFFNKSSSKSSLISTPKKAEFEKFKKDIGITSGLPPRRPPASSRPSTSSTKEYSVQLSSRDQHATSVKNSKQDSGFVNDIFMSDASDDEFLNQL